MSKRRIRHKSFTSGLSKVDQLNTSFAKPIFGSTMSKSIYIPQSQTINGKNVDLREYKRSKIYNRNISIFRDAFNQNDTSQLPFMSSLRHINLQQSTYEYNKTTQLRPFSVSMKRTYNQQTKKRISDIYSKPSRISTAYYRWHNKTGMNTNKNTQFQCSLRDYNKNWDKNPEENNFTNIVKPIKYKDIEEKEYDKKEIICPKQKRLFRMKNVAY